MSIKLAAQMYTIRDFTKTEKDLSESLVKLHRIGYPAVQASAVGAMDGDTPAVSASLFRRMMDDNALKCIATHRNWESLAASTDKEIEFHHQIGCNFAAIGGLPNSYSKDGLEGYSRFLKDAAPVIAKLKAAGIQFGVHNHDHEFERLGPNNRWPHSILLEDGGNDLKLEVDLYWVHHAGVNPIKRMSDCKGRTPVIHIKDMEVVPGAGPNTAAVGEGNMDWDSILPACHNAGVEWYAVEQDVCRRDPFDCLRSSFEYLRSKGV